MSVEIDNIYSDLGDIHYKLCMKHNILASRLMEQDCRGEKRDVELEAKRVRINEVTSKINDALSALREV